jgi:hypothetical protein
MLEHAGSGGLAMHRTLAIPEQATARQDTERLGLDVDDTSLVGHIGCSLCFCRDLGVKEEVAASPFTHHREKKVMPLR